MHSHAEFSKTSQLPPALLLVLLAALPVPLARAEPDAALEARALEARALVLRVELRRGPAADLAPLLAPRQNALARSLAIRALGRIGDRPDVNTLLARLVKDKTEPQRRLAIWAAGIARAKALYEPLAIVAHGKDPSLAATAAAALGWCPDPRTGAALAPLLGHPSADVREAALVGLGRARAHAHLVAAIAHLDAKQPEVRAAADFACWLMAHGLRAEKTKNQQPWDGDASLAAAFTPRLSSGDPEERMAGLRPMGVLLPKRLAKKDWPVLLGLVDDPDPRVVQGLIWRILTPREGKDVDAALARTLGHKDPKVRQLAAEALGQKKQRAPLQDAFARERDVRLRFVLAVEVARTGDFSAWRIAESLNWGPDAAVRERAEVLCHLFARKLGDALIAAEVAHPTATVALFENLGERKGSDVDELVNVSFASDDPSVVAAVIGFVVKRRLDKRYDDALFLAEEGATTPIDARLALIEGFVELLGDKKLKLGDKTKKRMTAWLDKTAKSDPSAFVRDKARVLLKRGRDLGNDYKGLPRPTEPLFGIELKGESDWLNEREITILAQHIREHAPKIRFRTSAGSFTVAVDAEVAPAHAVSLFLAAHAGVYNETRFHRVVPNFVIQGGDPSGTGAGHAGWFVPDEISPLPYVRGALGMPKSRKDDGGCQIFVMHTSYRPLNERYTGYGNVVEGLDTIDRIRVGDIIRRAEIVK